MKHRGYEIYRGYEISEYKDGIAVHNVRDFDPVHIFECGQCFRWLRQPDGTYTGVAKGRVVNVGYSDGRLVIRNASPDDFKNIWFDYFDLGRDYSEIKQKLPRDGIMEAAIEFGRGIRILRQDLWETLISFIISANNRIPMIMKVVSAISKTYGDEIEFEGRRYYTFPDAGRLADPGVGQLEACGGGFRCKYIVSTSRMVRDGVVDLGRLEAINTNEARDRLKRFPGVGDKVADCTLLYSDTKYDVFPTDVWVKRVMETLYFKREAAFKEIQDFASGHFRGLAGFAQQYLFYYARENRIGTG